MAVARVAPIGGQYNGFFDLGTGTVTYSTSGLRSNGGDAKFVCALSNALGPVNLEMDHVAGTREIVESFYYMTNSAPSAIFTTYSVNNASGNIGLSTTTSPNLRPFIGATTGTTVSVNVGQWYRVDTHITVSGGTTTLAWWLDGAAQTGLSVSQVDADLTFSKLGIISSATNITADFEFMDWVISYTGADAPLGQYLTYTLPIIGVGTHNITTNNFQKTGAVNLSNADTTSWTEISEIPNNAATNVSQVVIASTEYLEYAFQDTTVTGAPSVVGVFGEFAGSAAGGYVCEFRLYDGTTATSDLAASLTKSGTTVKRFKGQQTTAPSGGAWTTNLVNSLRLRFGFSSDVTPNPQFSSAVIVQAVPFVSSTYALSSGVI